MGPSNRRASQRLAVDCEELKKLTVKFDSFEEAVHTVSSVVGSLAEDVKSDVREVAESVRQTFVDREEAPADEAEDDEEDEVILIAKGGTKEKAD